jgi:hypothetical protein
MRIAYYPAFDDGAALTDRFWRAAHYLGPIAKVTEVSFAAAFRPGAPPAYLDQSLPHRSASFLGKAAFVAEPDLSADLVIVWDGARRADRELRGVRHIETLDPALLHEGDLSIELGARLAPRSEAQRAAAARRLADAIVSAAAPIAHVFGTGPSLATIDPAALPAGVSIVCNSIVKNHGLMDRLQPRFVTAIDPIFHAGPSAHAGAFRAELIAALRRHRSWFIVQERDAHLYEALLPPDVRELVIPAPVRFALAPNFDLERRFHLTATRNVLTLTLLPLAAALARDIYVYGCDGRRVEDGAAFWGYDPHTVFAPELDSQREAHPGFFTLEMDDYYALHAETVRRWIGAIERRGGRVMAGTTSLIPALASRPAPGVMAGPQPSAAFLKAGRAAFARRSAQALYGAVLSDPAAPNWLKAGLRQGVSGVRALMRRRGQLGAAVNSG